MSAIQEVGQGKYAIEYDEEQHRLCTYRNGEYWNDETGSKFIYCVWEELRTLRQQLVEAQTEIAEHKRKLAEQQASFSLI